MLRVCFAACVAALYTGSAFGKPPDCAASVVQRTVLRLANEHAPLPQRFGYAMDAIKVTAIKESEVSCTADLMRVYEESAVYQVTHITYTVTRKADGDLYISVDNLPR